MSFYILILFLYFMPVDKQTCSPCSALMVNLLRCLMQVEINAQITFGYANNESQPYDYPTGNNHMAIFLSDVGAVCTTARITGILSYRLSTGNASSSSL